jgi:hypothetical protein
VKPLVALMISTALAACGPSQSARDAGADADVGRRRGGRVGGRRGGRAGRRRRSAGFFIVGDIDGQTWLASYNIMPVTTNFLVEVATVEPSPPSREWQFNFTLPTDPFPYTLECVSNYIEFHEIGFVPERRFVSRTATSNCAVTFVERRCPAPSKAPSPRTSPSVAPRRITP